MMCPLCAKLTPQTVVAFHPKCRPVAYICFNCGYIRELLNTPSNPLPIGSIGGYAPWFTTIKAHT